MIRKRRGSRFLLLAGLLTAAVFLTASQAEALRFVVYGDSRGDSRKEPINKKVLDRINQEIIHLQPQPELVIFAGDMAHLGGTENFETWKDLLKTITDQGIKLYIAIGNHELYKTISESGQETTDLDLENQKEFQKIFDFLPDNGPDDDHKHLAYTFTSADGDSFFAVLAAYYVDPQTLKAYDGSLDRAQLAWVEKELANSSATHKFVITHRPVYGTEGGQVEPTLKELWTIMDHDLVDIYFCGHEHLYSRKTIDKHVESIYRNKVVQVLDGSCGAPLSSGKDVMVNKGQWHVKLTYNFSVVDVEDCLVRVKTYGWQNPSQDEDPELIVIDSFKRKTVGCLP